MKHAILLAGLLAATFPALAAAPQVDPVVAQAAPFIDRANLEWGTAIVSGDPDALSAPYAEDGIIIGPDGKVTVGKAAIRAMYAARPKRAQILEASATSNGRVAADADDVYEWGSASATVKTDAGVMKRSLGRFLTVWHRQGSVWLITRNIAF